MIYFHFSRRFKRQSCVLHSFLCKKIFYKKNEPQKHENLKKMLRESLASNVWVLFKSYIMEQILLFFLISFCFLSSLLMVVTSSLVNIERWKSWVRTRHRIRTVIEQIQVAKLNKYMLRVLTYILENVAFCECRT